MNDLLECVGQGYARTEDCRRLDTVKMRLVGGTHYMPPACNLAPEEVIVMYESLPPGLLRTFRLFDGRTS